LLEKLITVVMWTGLGPERWAGTAVAWFNTQAEAEQFADNHFAECEVVEEQ